MDAEKMHRLLWQLYLEQEHLTGEIIVEKKGEEHGTKTENARAL